MKPLQCLPVLLLQEEPLTLQGLCLSLSRPSITPTKGVILCPTKKTITAEGITNLFFHKVFLHFGHYDKIISNKGPQFTSAFAKELGRLLNYDLSLSTTYHSQSNRETEWVNQEIEIYLRIFCRDNSTSWTDSISHAEFTHNHCPYSVTSQSPFFLMMGYEPHALPFVTIFLLHSRILLFSSFSIHRTWHTTHIVTTHLLLVIGSHSVLLRLL